MRGRSWLPTNVCRQDTAQTSRRRSENVRSGTSLSCECWGLTYALHNERVAIDDSGDELGIDVGNGREEQRQDEGETGDPQGGSSGATCEFYSQEP